MRVHRRASACSLTCMHQIRVFLVKESVQRRAPARSQSCIDVTRRGASDRTCRIPLSSRRRSNREKTLSRKSFWKFPRTYFRTSSAFLSLSPLFCNRQIDIQCAKKRHVGNPSGSFPELYSEPRQHFSLFRRFFSIDKSGFFDRVRLLSTLSRAHAHPPRPQSMETATKNADRRTDRHRPIRIVD